MKNGIKIGKYRVSPKLFIALAALIIAVAGAVAGVSALRRSGEKKAAEQLGCTFDTTVFGGFSNVECLNEAIAVYTDSNGKKGLASLDGTVTQQAGLDSVYTASEKWRNVKYVCEGSLSEYPLLIDPETAVVTTRQYHGPKEPEKTAYWSATANHLAWYDELGYAGEVQIAEAGLAKGLYPVQASPEDSKKFGYINQNLGLEIALLYDGAGEFSEGLAPVLKGGKWGYINEKGVAAIDYEFDDVGENGAYGFVNGLAPARKNGYCGIINRKGEAVVGFEFDEILQGKNGKYIAKKGGVWGVITVNESIVEAESTSITEPAEESVMQGNYKVVTSGSYLNLRAAPDVNSASLERIPNGSVITVTDFTDGWAYTTYNSASGWVSMSYISQIETGSAASQADG